MSVIYPVKRDQRYTVTQEFTGRDKPQWVVRFCGDWVASSASKSSAIVRAVGHHRERMGALIVTEQKD
jgi:hypothetical protein